jgi:hypothetical protein
VTCGNTAFRDRAVVAAHARLRPPMTALRHRMRHVGCTPRRYAEHCQEPLDVHRCEVRRAPSGPGLWSSPLSGPLDSRLRSP